MVPAGPKLKGGHDGILDPARPESRVSGKGPAWSSFC